MILFSLPVHENVDVVIDQINNYRKFAPDALIVIHPSRQFKESSNIKEVTSTLDRVYLNSDPIYTAFGTVSKCHVSNFLYAEKIGLNFSHFCHHSSNDLFVKYGVEKYVEKNNFGFQTIEVYKEKFNFTHWKNNFRDDKAFRKMVSCRNKPIEHLASQVEGTFFPRDAYKEFCKIFMRFAWYEFAWPLKYSHGSNRYLLCLFDKFQRTPQRRKYFGKFFYPREEFYLPNFFNYYCLTPASPYCLMNWDKFLRVEPQDVDMIRVGKHPILGYDEIFTVKRVDRRIDDPLRIHIRNLS